MLFFLTVATYAAKDPTMPADWNANAPQASVIKNLTLSGIFSENNKNSAVINGLTVHVGDHIQGHEIVKIHKNSVTLKNNRGTFVIPLGTNVVTPVVNTENSKAGIETQ